MTRDRYVEGESTPVVGFVGLGAVGKPMALRLADWPGGLGVFDLAPEPLAELAAAGARVAGSVAELAAAVDVLCVMVRDDEQVRSVVDEILESARPGLIVAVHSTVAPHTPAALAELALDADVQVVDAPVSGGAMGAAAGTLAIMVGGSEEAYAACAGPFARLGTRVVRAGPTGAGTRMKLARNLLHFVSFTAVTEAQRLAEAAGLDLVELGAVVRHTDAITGGPGAIMHRDSTAPLAADDFWFGIFDHVRALGEKDLSFAVALAEELEVEVPLARLALDRLAPGLGLPTTEEKR
ncbi:NAD(P)-dependent oxidoreductase [Nocardioides sp.]|uniref:NAD(P)-dependent oxidoreductase n=1 Tax=Nocardioides sp. TaxID=35761 RepID=UPI003568DD8A